MPPYFSKSSDFTLSGPTRVGGMFLTLFILTWTILREGYNIELPQPQLPTKPPQPATQPSLPPTDKPLVGGALRMIQTLTSRYPMTFTKPQLAHLSKMSSRSGSYGTYLSLLKSRG